MWVDKIEVKENMYSGKLKLKLLKNPGEKPLSNIEVLHLVHPLTIQSSRVADKARNPAALWEIACVRHYIFNIFNC